MLLFSSFLLIFLYHVCFFKLFFTLLFLGNPSESAYPSITAISKMKHPLGIGQAIFFNNTILVLKV